MADLYLKSMDIPATGNTYKIVQPDGYYPDMTAGQITTNIHESDSVPYVFRKTPYNSTRESGDIVGASVAWNQLAKIAPSATTLGLTATIIDDSTFKLAGTISSTSEVYIPNATGFVDNIIGHKYLSFVSCNGANVSTYFKCHQGTKYQKNILNDYMMWEHTSGTGRYYSVETIATGTVDYTFHWNKIDLTLALGSTIADYIYTLESGTAGAGIAKLREWGFFTKPYYAYNAGSIESVNVSKHRMTGLNQWDEEQEVGAINTDGTDKVATNTIRSKNICDCLPNTEYYLGNDIASVYWYDANDAFISFAYNNATGNLRTSPSNAYGFRFVTKSAYGTTYNHDICVNLSNPAINGTYEPYTVNEYPLDYSLTLRGVYELDANNNLKANGDVYEEDGTVTRKFGTITLDGTLSYIGNATNGFYVQANGLAKLFDYHNAIRASVLSATTNNNSITNATFQITGYKDTNNSYPSQNWLYIYLDSSYTTTNAYKDYFTAHPTTVVYPLATPTTETADPYNEVQVCSPYGTEEFVDAGVAAGTRDVAIPVGHNTEYMKNIVGAIEGIPLPPSANGTYTLKVTVASGVPTYSWVSG